MSVIERWPLAYLLTFSCYGTWLHGDERGSVDRDHRIHGEPLLPPNDALHRYEAAIMNESAYSLSDSAQAFVLRTLCTLCSHRGWILRAAHVRTRHVHAVIKAAESPGRLLTEIKAHATRALSGLPGESNRAKRWSRGGSKRYLWKPEHVDAAVHYVVHEQGAPMAVYVAHPDPHDAPRRVHGDW